MVAIKLLAGLLFSFATAQDIVTLAEDDTSDSLSLLQLRSQRTSPQSQETVSKEDTGAVAITKIHTQRRCPGNGAKRGKFDSAQECADSMAGLGVKYMSFWTMNNKNSVKGICIGWTDAQCDDVKKFKVHKSVKNKMFSLSEEEEADAAEAVGDPHMSMSDGDRKDMCCDNGPCRACDALVQEDTSAVAITKIHTQRRCPGNGAKRGKFDSAQECADSMAGLGVKYMSFWTMNNKNSVKGICIGWTDTQCDDVKKFKVHKSVKNKMFSLSEEEDVDGAEAVGDPHMTVSSGTKEDLCCEGGHCHPCQ